VEQAREGAHKQLAGNVSSVHSQANRASVLNKREEPRNESELASERRSAPRRRDYVHGAPGKQPPAECQLRRSIVEGANPQFPRARRRTRNHIEPYQEGTNEAVRPL